MTLDLTKLTEKGRKLIEEINLWSYAIEACSWDGASREEYLQCLRDYAKSWQNLVDYIVELE